MSELKPCPFCGGEARRIDIDATKPSVPDAGASYIACGRCYTCSPIMFGEKTGLEESWNRRAISTIGPDAIRREERLIEALTPSAETKAAYIGDFTFDIPDEDEDGDELQRQISVPWTTIKKIMAAIRKRAAILGTEPTRGSLPETKSTRGANTLAELISLLKIARDNKTGILLDWVEIGIALRNLSEPARDKNVALTEDEYLSECDAFGRVPVRVDPAVSKDEWDSNDFSGGR